MRINLRTSFGWTSIYDLRRNLRRLEALEQEKAALAATKSDHA